MVPGILSCKKSKLSMSKWITFPVFSQVKWHPDGHLVYFSPGIDGGAACWIVDPATGMREILVDSSIIVWKPVDDFSISPAGEMIAFLAQDRQIWVLILPK